MQERYVATADLGSSKIALSVTRITGNEAQVIYYRETPSDGIRYSRVFNPMRASEALRNAVETAEKELNIKILQLVVGLPRFGIVQQTSGAEMERSDPSSCITAEEVDIIKNNALDSYPIQDQTKEMIYGAVAQSFTADQLFQQNENDVIGAPAEKLTGNFKVFLGSKSPVNNIDLMLNNLGIAPALKIFIPQVEADAVLTDEEKDNGVALIEMGAGVTSVSIYKGKILRYYGSVPFGGGNVTTDIKYECGFKETLAENIKLAYGACVPDKLPSHGEKIIQINDDETGTYEHLPVKYLAEIIDCRVREIMDGILFLIQESGYAERLRNGIVLTGGGANLANISNLLKEMSGFNVRTGYPRTRQLLANGCPGISEASAMSTVAMILAVKDDSRLNCTTPKEDEPDSPAGTDDGEPNLEGSVFEPTSYPQDEKPARHGGDKVKKSTKKPYKFTWTKKFENTVGKLFDTME